MLPQRPFLGAYLYAALSQGVDCWLKCKLQVTIPTLLDMRLKGITTNQTSAMTLDFVAYNGIIDMFFYVSINFDFTTSGYIDKDIKIYPIKLPDLTSSFFPIRLILEVFIITFTVGRLAKCMRAVYRVALAGIKKGKAGAFGHRLTVVLQASLGVLDDKDLFSKGWGAVMKSFPGIPADQKRWFSWWILKVDSNLRVELNETTKEVKWHKGSTLKNPVESLQWSNFDCSFGTCKTIRLQSTCAAQSIPLHFNAPNVRAPAQARKTTHLKR